ncbi:MAG: 4Fe-4S binding protein [Clostridiales Family XIII bacterium]|jgi:Pyruvate/2-oxoacid:ferredoxin oxidoreductase delta subunit|nr:4Fe-4S binding protein [Clostridiales Family XIII bacterium]
MKNDGGGTRTVARAIELYDASLAETGNCGEAALRALAFVAGRGLNEGLLRIGAVHACGSHVGNRCAVIQAALVLCSLEYGRMEGDGNRIPTGELAAKLQENFRDRLGHCHCNALNPQGGDRCPKGVSDAALSVAAELLLEAPELVEAKMDELKGKFKVDESLWAFADHFMTGADWAFVNAAGDDGRIDVSKFKTPAVSLAFRHGVIDKVGDAEGGVEGYRLGTFHRRIDCFMRGERVRWRALPDEVKQAVLCYEQDIRRWVLPRRKAGHNMSVVNALPIEQALQEIEKAKGNFFLQECDCRIYRENPGGHPTDVCLHFPASLLNTNADRGHARLLTREEAIEVMRRSDAAGLVHNFEGDAFCNCCGCCCWAIRGIEAYRAEGLDAAAEYVNAPYVATVEETCIGCGVCVKRCPTGALSVSGKAAHVDAERCIGCGVCRAVCGKSALAMRRRDGYAGGSEDACRAV